MFTGYQYLIYFHIKHREGAKEGYTVYYISLKKYFYKDRLIQLNLIQKIAMGHDGSL